MICFEDVEEKETNWIYYPYVPRGKITLCAAYPGVGKTYCICYMCACISTGKQFFNISPFDNVPETAIYISAEDGIADTLKKRLRVCGANMRNIFTVEDKNASLTFDSPELEKIIKDKKPALLVFDPFQAYIGEDVDMNAANRTRAKLNHLAFLAEKYDVGIMLICHFNKNQKGDAITRILGSTDIVGIARSYLALATIPGEIDMKYMSHEKSSLAKRGKTILFHIDPEDGGVVYDGENYLTMDDYTALVQKNRNRAAPSLDGAKEFLLNNMPDGYRSAEELKNLAEANNISISTLNRARKELNITTKRLGFGGACTWYLP